MTLRSHRAPSNEIRRIVDRCWKVQYPDDVGFQLVLRLLVTMVAGGSKLRQKHKSRFFSGLSPRKVGSL